MVTDTADLETELAELESAEDFLNYFNVDFDSSVVHVNRLHILQRFHDYLGHCPETRRPTRAEYRACLAMAYEDFVKSDAISEKVFKVLKRASGITTVPLSAIGYAKR